MKNDINLPVSKKLVWPILRIFKDSSPLSKSELDIALAKLLGLSQEQLEIRHDRSRSEQQYRSAWALSYGKKAGYFVNPTRNQWGITDSGRSVQLESEVKV